MRSGECSLPDPMNKSPRPLRIDPAFKQVARNTFALTLRLPRAQAEAITVQRWIAGPSVRNQFRWHAMLLEELARRGIGYHTYGALLMREGHRMKPHFDPSRFWPELAPFRAPVKVAAAPARRARRKRS